MKDVKLAKLDATIENNIFSLLSKYCKRVVGREDLNKQIIADLGLDSFAVVELVYEIEMYINRPIGNSEVKGIKTVNDLISIVATHFHHEK